MNLPVFLAVFPVFVSLITLKTRNMILTGTKTLKKPLIWKKLLWWLLEQDFLQFLDIWTQVRNHLVYLRSTRLQLSHDSHFDTFCSVFKIFDFYRSSANLSHRQPPWDILHTTNLCHELPSLEKFRLRRFEVT